MFVPFKPAPSKQLSRTPDAPQRWTVGRPQAGDFAYAYGFNHNIMKAPVRNVRPQFMDGTNYFLLPDNLQNRRKGKPKPKLTKSSAMFKCGRHETNVSSPYPQYHNSIASQEYEPARKRQRTISRSSKVANYFNVAMPINVSSNINSSNDDFGPKTRFYGLPVSEPNTNNDYDDAND